MIISYRKSSIIFAAFDCGLIETLLANSKSVKQLTEELKLDTRLLYLFLKVLTFEGIVEENNTVYTLTEDCKKELKNYKSYQTIIDFEKILQDQWLHSKEIVSSLTNGLNKRTYDVQGMGPAEKLLYYQSMYNDNIRLLAKQIKREKKEADTLLELGRSSGLISCALQEEITIQKILLCLYEEDIYHLLPWHPIKCEVIKLCDLRKQSLDIIVIHNTIHYLEEEKLLNLMENIADSMHESSLLFIGDIFLDDAGYQNNYLIDWITHGGTYQLYRKEIIDLAKEKGLYLKKQITMKQIPLTLLVFRKEDL